MADEEVRQLAQRRLRLVGSVFGALYDFRVGAEGGVVDEWAVVHAAQVDVEFHPVGQGVQAVRRVVAIETKIEGEVIAGPGRNHQQRHAMLGGDAGNLGLRAVTAGHAEHVGSRGDGIAGQCGDVDVFRPVQQRNLRAECFRLRDQPESSDLSIARTRVHDHERLANRRRDVLVHMRFGPAQRDAGDDPGDQPQRGRERDDPPEVREDEDRHNRRDREHGHR